MKILSPKVHGILDYVVGLLFLALPYLAGWEIATPQARVLLILGALTITYSIMTRYEVGLLGIIPFRVHLIIDMISGIFLLASPWLLGFADEMYLPHVLLGAFEIVAVLMTSAKKDPERNLHKNI